MGWNRWSLGKFILRRIARAQGFPDPVGVFSDLRRFARPAEVWVPTELLRSGAVMQARGLMNTQVIQNNPDWIWPYWAQQQFDPKSDSFIPRAFSLTHINLTHRNWTAIGLPGLSEFPIVDPRGLITPLFDGWSVDFWLWKNDRDYLVPSKCPEAVQTIGILDSNLTVTTILRGEGFGLELQSQVVLEGETPVCRTKARALTASRAWLVVALRPYNPEGVSFVNHLSLLDQGDGWKIENKSQVHFDKTPSRHIFSNYSDGDVFNHLADVPVDHQREIRCDAGLSSAAALFETEPQKPLEVTVRSALKIPPSEVIFGWKESLAPACRLEIPDDHFRFLFETALSSMVLHSPDDVYPGPYTYKRFWFRDAAFILYAMIAAGLTGRVEKVLDRFAHRQTPGGYFLSQNGEWDSNGQALWVLERFCTMTNTPPKKKWQSSILNGAAWIRKKRLPKDHSPHSGLLPAGFSAEHFGSSDYYYWDDFWAIGGLHAAASMARRFGNPDAAESFEKEAADLMNCVKASLEMVQIRLGGRAAMPASPYRRLDAGAIGSLAAGYPLQLLKPNDARLKETVSFILENCFLKNGFYQEIGHSGINAYLTLDVAEVLLRMGDPRFEKIVAAVANWASPTGQWPEAIHPRTGGGCMGDGQHLWAAAEWVLMIRNMFVREEEQTRTLVFGSGIPEAWLKTKERLFLGPVLTSFGKVSLTIETGCGCRVSWQADWHEPPSQIEVRLPGHAVAVVPASESSVELKSGSCP